MRILVTGTNGQVGWELIRKGSFTEHNILGCDRNALDISDRRNIAQVIKKNQPDLIVNCAAYTAVDRAEEEPKKAYAVNQQAPANLADQCTKRGIPFIHLSTDYVFNGVKTTPYKENDLVSPLGVYGESKEAGEQEVRLKCARHIILRTSWVYGAHGHNFVKTMLKLGQERKVLKIVNDQWGCPTYAGDIADALLLIINKIFDNTFNSWGTFHCCGSTALTWYDFATQIFPWQKMHILLW